jgi:uncharacterized membrane protein SirB2
MPRWCASWWMGRVVLLVCCLFVLSSFWCCYRLYPSGEAVLFFFAAMGCFLLLLRVATCIPPFPWLAAFHAVALQLLRGFSCRRDFRAKLPP